MDIIAKPRMVDASICNNPIAKSGTEYTPAINICLYPNLTIPYSTKKLAFQWGHRDDIRSKISTFYYQLAVASIPNIMK